MYCSDHVGIRPTRGESPPYLWHSMHNGLGFIANFSSWSGSVTNHAPNTDGKLIVELVELDKEDRERLGEVLSMGRASAAPLFGITRLRGSAGDSNSRLAYVKTTMIAAFPRFSKHDGQPLTSGHKQPNFTY